MTCPIPYGKNRGDTVPDKVLTVWWPFEEAAMNKGELIERISKDAKLSKTQATAALNSTLAAVQAALKKGGKVTLVGFGTFSVGKRKARTGRNPQTGAKLKIAARRIAKFAPGAGLKKAVNRGR